MNKIGELLVESGVIKASDLEKALERQSEMSDKKPIGEILIEMGFISINELVKYLEFQLRNKFE